MVEVNIKLYEILKCGYYKNRSKDPSFGSTKLTIEQVVDWVKDKPIRANSTYDPPLDSSLLKAHFLNILKSKTGDYYFSIWNAVPATEQNAVAAISGSSVLGLANMEFSDFKKDYIPGFATYFWLSPIENRLATVRFRRSYNGHQSFKALMQGFLSNNPTYALLKKDLANESVTISGYDIEEKSDPRFLYFPKFRTSSMTKHGPISYIKKNISRVTKILGRTRLVPGIKKALIKYNFLFGLFGIRTLKENLNSDFEVKYEIPCSLSLMEFNEIYETWKSDDAQIDVGFRIGGELIWLSHEIQKTEIELEIPMENKELYSLNAIMEQIERNKERILYECSK